MLAAKGDGQAPPDLMLYWRCERFSALPDTGAVLDQDYALLERMTALNGVFAAVVRWRNLGGKRIHELTYSEGRILELLRLEGISFND